MAAFFGASTASDSFYAAFLIVNILYQVLIGGTLVPAFLPVYSEYLASRNLTEARTLLQSSFGLVLVALVVVAGFIFVDPGTFARIVAPGFAEDATNQLSVLMRILAPGIVFLGLAGLAGAELNSSGRFLVPALGTTFVSLGILCVLVVGASRWGMAGVAVGAVLGMMAQLAFQLPFVVSRTGCGLRVDLRHPGVRRVAGLALPLALYTGLAQVSPVIERIVGSTLMPGTVSWLSYAQKITAIPHVLFAGSIVIAAFPPLSRAAAEGNTEQFRDCLASALRLACFQVIPVSVLMVLASTEIVEWAFQRGQFSRADTQSTGVLVAAYSLGVFPAAVGAILLRAFHAMQDMRTPLWIGAFTTTVYALLAIALTRSQGIVGLGLALSLAAMLSTLMLSLILQRKTRFLDAHDLVRSLLKVMLAATIAAGVYQLSAEMTWPRWGDSVGQSRVQEYIPRIGLSGLVYLFGSAILGVWAPNRPVRAALSRVGSWIAATRAAIEGGFRR